MKWLLVDPRDYITVRLANLIALHEINLTELLTWEDTEVKKVYGFNTITVKELNSTRKHLEEQMRDNNVVLIFKTIKTRHSSSG